VGFLGGGEEVLGVRGFVSVGVSRVGRGGGVGCVVLRRGVVGGGTGGRVGVGGAVCEWCGGQGVGGGGGGWGEGWCVWVFGVRGVGGCGGGVVGERGSGGVEWELGGAGRGGGGFPTANVFNHIPMKALIARGI